MKKFKIHWLSGGPEIIEGKNLSDAFQKAGYGGGVYTRIDYWEELTRNSLLTRGGEAEVTDVLAVFEYGNLHDFARKELPDVVKRLDVRTIAGLAAYYDSEIRGPQSRYTGNKTLSWLEAVFEEFGFKLLHGEPLPEFDCPPKKLNGVRM